jgi:hypothetical protein
VAWRRDGINLEVNDEILAVEMAPLLSNPVAIFALFFFLLRDCYRANERNACLSDGNILEKGSLGIEKVGD